MPVLSNPDTCSSGDRSIRVTAALAARRNSRAVSHITFSSVTLAIRKPTKPPRWCCLPCARWRKAACTTTWEADFTAIQWTPSGLCRTSRKCSTIRRSLPCRIWRAIRSLVTLHWREVARDIFEYVLRDLSHPSGGFYSAEDADSVIDPSNPKEKGEGAFYIWTKDEIDEVVGQPQAEWFSYVFGVERSGNVTEDPHGEFTEKNILYQHRSIADAARQFHVDEDTVRFALKEAARKLLDRRSVTRVRPHLDDKVLTAWNGLMISAFAKGGFILNEPKYLGAAKRSADFVLRDMYKDGVLHRRWREGESAIPAFLDDYAFLAQGLLDLYEASFEVKYLNAANELTEKMRELFEDQQAGAFYSTAEGDSSLVMRIKEDYDGAEPSGNSIAILNLLRLSYTLGNEGYREAAEKALSAFASKMSDGPTAMPQMLIAVMKHNTPPQQIVLAGEDISGMLDALRTKFLPFHTLLRADDVPASRNMLAVNGSPAAYVCENFACQMPVTNPADLTELLK